MPKPLDMPASITFDRDKYGRDLLVDAAAVPALPNFITAPVAHRLGFHEVALLERAGGFLEVDGTGVALGRNTLCFTRPGQVRCWRLDQPLRGDVVFFESAFLDEFVGGERYVDALPVFASAPGAVQVDDATFKHLTRVARDMKDELSGLRDDSADMLRAHLHRLLVEVQRHAGSTHVVRVGGHHHVYRRFARLLDENFRELRRVGAYADKLGVSAGYLNECVRRAVGTTAGDAIQQRIHLEARRLLLRTDWTSAHVAAVLAFSDASYFHRFFKRHAGATPGEYRRRRKIP